jgi:UDP-glucose 4-epimerase
MNSVLVTGGCGYIGSHTVSELLKNHFFPVVVDNLSNGVKESIAENVPFYKIDVRDSDSLRPVFAQHNISSVIHLAGLAIVAESFERADDYMDHNLNGTISILKLCKEFKMSNFIFSSSSTLYGNANRKEKLTEKHNIFPMSPYGKSKQLCEEKIFEYAHDENLNYFNLRYFNVAGASQGLMNGQRGHGSQRLLFEAAQASLKRTNLMVHGDDYETPDGTCVRDYIHVEDIADIHVKLLNYLQIQKCQKTLNCGYGEGFSVLQILEKFRSVNHVDFKINIGARRRGDPEYLVGDNSELVKLLNWTSKFKDPLEAICRSTYEWEKKKLLSGKVQ